MALCCRYCWVRFSSNCKCTSPWFTCLGLAPVGYCFESPVHVTRTSGDERSYACFTHNDFGRTLKRRTIIYRSVLVFTHNDLLPLFELSTYLDVIKITACFNESEKNSCAMVNSSS